jgi:hypothetical protein
MKYILEFFIVIGISIFNPTYGQKEEKFMLDCLLPKEADQIVNANQWQLKGKIKRVFVIKYNSDAYLTSEIRLDTMNKTELEKAFKKVKFDSTEIYATWYSFSPLGKLNDVYNVHLDNSWGMGKTKGTFRIKQTPFNYSLFDTIRTTYKFNGSGQIEEIVITPFSVFELRKYDINNNLISIEEGLDKYLIFRKRTRKKTEYRISKNNMEIFLTSNLLDDIYPFKTNDILLQNGKKVRDIGYDIVSGDTSYFRYFVYSDTLNTRLVETLFSMKDTAVEHYVDKTKYNYNTDWKITEETTYFNDHPRKKVIYAYDKYGLITDKTTYNFDDEILTDWKLDSIDLNIYLTRDKFNNPTKIVSISGVVQKDNKIDYEVKNVACIEYDYYD